MIAKILILLLCIYKVQSLRRKKNLTPDVQLMPVQSKYINVLKKIGLKHKDQMLIIKEDWRD